MDATLLLTGTDTFLLSDPVATPEKFALAEVSGGRSGRPGIFSFIAFTIQGHFNMLQAKATHEWERRREEVETAMREGTSPERFEAWLLRFAEGKSRGGKGTHRSWLSHRGAPATPGSIPPGNHAWTFTVCARRRFAGAARGLPPVAAFLKTRKTKAEDPERLGAEVRHEPWALLETALRILLATREGDKSFQKDAVVAILENWRAQAPESGQADRPMEASSFAKCGRALRSFQKFGF